MGRRCIRLILIGALEKAYAHLKIILQDQKSRIVDNLIQARGSLREHATLAICSSIIIETLTLVANCPPCAFVRTPSHGLIVMTIPSVNI
jgi:hypothetical protein